MAATIDLVDIMKGLARGDVAAYEPFYAVATPAVRSLLGRELRGKGVPVDSDRLDDIVGDCLLELVRISPLWRADGGAKPWNWARPRLVALAYSALGIFTDDLDERADMIEASPPIAACDDDVVIAFELITEINRQGRALRRALYANVSERDRRVWLDVVSEQGASNSSPSVTVAALHGLTPANVRKICQRVRTTLTRLAETDASYEDMLGLPVLAA